MSEAKWEIVNHAKERALSNTQEPEWELCERVSGINSVSCTTEEDDAFTIKDPEMFQSFSGWLSLSVPPKARNIANRAKKSLSKLHEYAEQFLEDKN